MIREEQFVRLFVSHEGELRAFALTLMPCPADAEDVMQEACVAMWQRIGDLEKKQSFRPWAYTFVRFTALNRIRKRNRSPLMFSGELMEAGVFALPPTPDFKGNVAAVHTNPSSKGSSSNAHYGGNAETYMSVGEATGKAMAELLQKP